MVTQEARKPGVLFVSGIGGSTRRYRCLHHQEQLTAQQMPTALREDDDPQLLVDLLDYDLFVLHRVPYSALVGLLIDVARQRGKPVVFETDDLLFDPELAEHIGFLDTLSPEDAHRYRLELERLAQTFQRCDCVLTTTPFLAQQARERGKPAYVHGNVPSAEMVQISEQAFASGGREAPGDGQPLVIGFFSGTGSHNRDFQTIAGPLIWALERYPDLWLHISGHLVLGPEFEPFMNRIRRAPYVSWRELPHVIAGVDVNLAPLEQDNPFCRAKSEIKFVEAGLVGVPTIASRVDAYQAAISEGEDGLLAGSAEEWRAALQLLVENPQRRREMGQAARRTAYDRYVPRQRGEKLLETLQDISRQYGRAPAPQQDVLRALADGARQYGQEVQARLAQQEEQLESLRATGQQYENQLAHLARLVEKRERTIEAIMQGRVMRWMTGTQRWLRRVTGRGQRSDSE